MPEWLTRIGEEARKDDGTPPSFKKGGKEKRFSPHTHTQGGGEEFLHTGHKEGEGGRKKLKRTRIKEKEEEGPSWLADRTVAE